MKRSIFILIPLIIIIMMGSSVAAQSQPLDVVATTTIIADVARNVGGGLANVTALIPPESDAHAFQLTPRAAARLTAADLVLVNGAGLEESLLELVEETAEGRIVNVSEGATVLTFGDMTARRGTLGVNAECESDEDHGDEDEDHDTRAAGGCDPHFWMDPRNVMLWTQNIAAAFAAADTANAAVYQANAEAYRAELEALDVELREMLTAIPAEGRVLVTNHEFMGYFAAAYDFEILGVVLPGGSTLSGPTPRQLADLSAAIAASGVPAIFAETGVTTDLAHTVAEETGAVVVRTLYSEALSAAGGPADTYLDYMRYNASVIVEALGG